MQQRIFVTGSTGQQGGATARALLAKGLVVHALARDPTCTTALALQSAGAHIFKGDMLDVKSLQDAMVGVTGVFLNTFGLPPSPYIENTEIRQAQNVISAAIQAGTVTSIVVSTVVCADRHLEWAKQDPKYGLAPYYGTKHAVEEMVRNSGITNYTILRPGWLMHNYFSFMPRYNWPELETEHVLNVSYAPEAKIAHCSPKDVGRFAAAAFVQPEKFHKKEITIASENLTIGDVAKTLSEASGRYVKTRFRDEIETAAINPDIFPNIRYQLLMRVDPSVYEFDLEESYKYGIPLTSFEDYFKDEVELRELRKTLSMNK